MSEKGNKIRVYRWSTDVEYQRIMTENRSDALTGKLGRNTDELRLRPSKLFRLPLLVPKIGKPNCSKNPIITTKRFTLTRSHESS